MLKRDEKFTYTHIMDAGGYKNPLSRELDTADPFDGFEIFGHISPEILAIDPTIYIQKVFFDETGFPRADMPIEQGVLCRTVGRCG